MAPAKVNKFVGSKAFTLKPLIIKGLIALTEAIVCKNDLRFIYNNP